VEKKVWLGRSRKLQRGNGWLSSRQEPTLAWNLTSVLALTSRILHNQLAKEHNLSLLASPAVLIRHTSLRHVGHQQPSRSWFQQQSFRLKT
jgi:hypothetical protein